MDVTPRLSVIIPAYNEARRLPANLSRVAALGAELGLGAPGQGWEVLVVVEQSEDDTLACCLQAAPPGVEVIDNGPRRGKGHAVRSGMLRARGAIRIFTDADLSTPPEEIGRFLEYLDTHREIDVLVGDRRQGAPTPGGRRQGPLRHTLGGLYSAAARALAGGLLPPGLADTQCGFKAYRARAAGEIFSRQHLDGFAFDVETLLLAARLGFHVEALPVRGWADSPASTLLVVRDGAQMLWDLVRVRALVETTLRGQVTGGKAGPARMGGEEGD